MSGIPRALLRREYDSPEAVHDEPEPELIGDARIGDKDAMAELFRRHYRHSTAVARRILPAQEEFLMSFSRLIFLRSKTSKNSAQRRVLKPGSHELP